MMTLVVDIRGAVRCVYAEDLDLAAIGSVRITRASHVEPDEAGRWWADIAPAGGPILGPFARRSAALAAERQWLEQNLISLTQGPAEQSAAGVLSTPADLSSCATGLVPCECEGVDR